MDIFKWLLDTGGFMSHGHCYLWNPGLVRLHVLSDVSIGIAYIAISLTLVYLVRRSKRDIPFHWMFLAFGTFIIACGATHLMEVWTIWDPVYWLAGSIKLLTAMASVTTAFALPPLVPKVLTLIRAAKLSEERKEGLEAANAALQREVAERKHAEEQVRRLNEELEAKVLERTNALVRANEALAEKAAIVEHSNDAIFGMALDDTISSWNPAAERVYGYTNEEVIGRSSSILLPAEHSQELHRVFGKLRAGERIEPFETVFLRNGGDLIDVHLTISPICDASGAIVGASVIGRDITERRRTERQLRETQRLESLGLIAGGVAHDFNNLLVGILGNVSLSLDVLDTANPAKPLLQNAVLASERAAALTRQLLAYAGKGRFITEKIDLSQLVREISELVQTSIPKTVQLRLELSDKLPVVDADPSQMQQLIMNLVINGAEAIGEGRNGSVLVTTDLQEVDEAYLRNNFAGERVAPGTYVSLEVHDTGIGMDKATIARIFDPFFTTKFTGRGLGLAAVLGIVRGHKGTIRVYSIPQKGSTFKVLLPVAHGQVLARPADDLHEALRGTGTILVVDDEEIVRNTARAVLQRFGYDVLVAPDGASGLEVFQKHADGISAVVLDMTMPGMSGEETFRSMRGIAPRVCVLLSSGYNEVEAIRRFTSKGFAGFVQKPYTGTQLARILKRALAQGRDGTSATGDRIESRVD